MSPMRIFPLLLVALVATGQPKPAPLTVSTWVREDLFAGYIDNDLTRHEAGMQKLQAILQETPNKADALAWLGASQLYFAVRAYDAGDTGRGDGLYRKAQETLDRAIAVEKPMGELGAVLAVTGGIYAHFADRLPQKHRRDAWELARLNYSKLRDMQMPAFSKYPPHIRGEVMAGLAMAAARLGDVEQAKKLTEELVSALPNTPYAVFGRKAMETNFQSKMVCVSCHDAGRLQAVLARQAAK